MSDPACRTFRELLGVYVVGAIEPNERSLLDAHLNQCYGCREELASLAVLPALLHRIPPAEAEQFVQSGEDAVERGRLRLRRCLPRLLEEVGARRRTRRLRGVLAAAAALIVAVGGGVGGVVRDQRAASARPARRSSVVSAHRGDLSMTVKYGESSWGTEIWVKVDGVREWTWLQVLGRHGQRSLTAGRRLADRPNGDGMWYPSRG